MICPKCGYENSEESLFCSKCGLKLSSEPAKKGFSFSKNRIALLCIALAAIIVVSISVLNNPIAIFKKNVRNNNIAEALEVYDSKIKGDGEQEKRIESFLNDEIDKIVKSFYDGKIDYNSAKMELEKIKSTNLVYDEISEATGKLNKLNNSRTAFAKAEAFLKANDLVSALAEYKKVVPEDPNYNKAQEQLSNNEKQYKEQVLKNAADSANAKDYTKAISLIKEALSVIPEDIDLSTQLSIYEKQLIEKFKNEQLVTVESAKVIIQHPTYKALYPDMVQVILKNKSQKTVKSLEVGILGYDKNGYPLKVKGYYDFAGGDYEFVGLAEDVNITAGSKFGANKGWQLNESHGISKVLACVKRATFYDGTVWDNPYYQTWLDEHKEKPFN